MATSSFLHSPAWQRFQESLHTPCGRLDEQLFLQRRFQFGTYWASSRCVFSKPLALPEWTSGACFLRIEPEDEESKKLAEAFAAEKQLTLVPTAAVQPRQTLILKLDRPAEELTASWKQKHRYNLRIAQKAGLSTEIFSSDLEKHAERFWSILSHTAQRQGFRTHPKVYYQQMLAILQEEQMVHLVFVSHEGHDLAAMLLLTYGGTATYLHGASIQEKKQLMAPYLLHWSAMEHAVALGCASYDFWGTDAVFSQESGEWLPQEGHPSYGTTRFKLGFGGEIVTYPGAFDLVLKPFCYNAYKSLRALRGSKRAFS